MADRCERSADGHTGSVFRRYQHLRISFYRRFQSPQGSETRQLYPEFPLFAHANGSWAKKIRGELHYFGGWGDPEGALEAYNRTKDDLHAGRRPREVSKGVEVRHLCNDFCNAKNSLVEVRELSPRTMQDYSRTTDLIAAAFGAARLVEDVGPDDFAELRKSMAKKWGPHMLAKIIQCVRSVFKHAYDAGMIAVPCGSGWASSGQPRRRCAWSRRSTGRSSSPPTRSAGCSAIRPGLRLLRVSLGP